MALRVATISNSIAALSVSGLVLKDIDEIPAEVGDRTPILIPMPDYMTDFEMVRDSFGSGDTAKMTVQYTLNYRLCYIRAGAGRANVLEYFDNMVSMCAAIMDAVLAIGVFTGAEDIVPVGIVNMGIVNDPADQPYYGCDLSFRVLEFVN